MPICPYCRKPVTSAFTVWCTCGTNLTKFDNLPSGLDDLKTWLEKNSPDVLRAPVIEGGLLEQAKQALIKEQEITIKKRSQTAYEVAQVKQLFQDFLSSCHQEGIPPNYDIGRLRRDRYKQQKKLGQTDFLPVKNFKQTPGYHFRLNFGRVGEDLYLSLGGELYRHLMNVPDPFPIEELLKFASVEKVAEGLRQTLVELLKQRQTSPPPGAQ